jgi:hypothetical protein
MKISPFRTKIYLLDRRGQAVKRFSRDYTDFSFSKENPTFAENLSIINYNEIQRSVKKQFIKWKQENTTN